MSSLSKVDAALEKTLGPPIPEDVQKDVATFLTVALPGSFILSPLIAVPLAAFLTLMSRYRGWN